MYQFYRLPRLCNTKPLSGKDFSIGLGMQFRESITKFKSLSINIQSPESSFACCFYFLGSVLASMLKLQLTNAFSNSRFPEADWAEWEITSFSFTSPKIHISISKK